MRLLCIHSARLLMAPEHNGVLRGQVSRRLTFIVAFVLHVITSQRAQTCCYDSDHAHQEVLNCNGTPVDVSGHSWNEFEWFTMDVIMYGAQKIRLLEEKVNLR